MSSSTPPCTTTGALPQRHDVLAALTWDPAVSAEDLCPVLSLLQARGWPCAGLQLYRLPAWLLDLHCEGEAVFDRGMLLFLASHRLLERTPLVLLKPPADRLLGMITLHAIYRATGQFPVGVRRWHIKPGGRMVKGPPTLQLLAESFNSLLTDPSTAGLVALMKQAAESLGLSDQDTATHENTLRVLVPAIRALQGRCLLLDLLSFVRSGDTVVDLLHALPAELPEAADLNHWIYPPRDSHAEGDSAAVMDPLLNSRVETLANLMAHSLQLLQDQRGELSEPSSAVRRSPQVP